MQAPCGSGLLLISLGLGNAARGTLVHRPPQQTKGQTFMGVVPSCFLNMQAYNEKEIGGKEIIRSTAVIYI